MEIPLFRRIGLASLLFVAAGFAQAQYAPLINLSSLGQTSTASVMTTGFVIGPGGGATVLLRAVGPTLKAAPYKMTTALADPVLTLYSGSTVLASNSAWNSADAATMSSVGAFALLAGSKDCDIVGTNLPPGTYTTQVTSASKATGMAMLEIYYVSGSSALLNLSNRVLVGTGSAVATNGFILGPGAQPRTLLLRGVGPTLASYGVAGAMANPTLTLNSGSSAIDYNDNWSTPIGSADASAMDLATDFAAAGAFALPSGSLDAAIVAKLGPGNYTMNVSGVGNTTGVAMVEIYDITNALASSTGSGGGSSSTSTTNGTLYLAKLNGGSGSTAAGTATIIVSPDGSTATVNIGFTGLSSTEIVAHLVIGTPGTGTFVDLTIPYGQVSGLTWNFSPTGQYTSADLLTALQNGQIGVEIDTANLPNGELEGQFIQSAGSQVFTAPSAPPTIDLTKMTSTDAARFLTQATFGPTQADINTLMSEGYSQWITNQMALPETSHLAATRADAAAFPNTGQYPITANNRQEAWWNISVNAPDQLRQRVAFALSQIFVVSDVASSLAQQPEALANYYDTLANDAFGNYRQLLQDVTLSPVMGNYLNMLRNTAANPKTGTSADENYAREVMQLFTIGLNELNPDGTLQLDGNGLPIPTYDQATIVQTANVLTGWSYHSAATNPSFTGGAADWYDPMQLYPTYHDNTLKTIVGGVIVPANEGGAADLKLELDTLFNHQNAAAFFVRGLIQRLVTSNPSPGYVYRVEQVFANDGTGTRGNLAAVVKAILLDYEARSPALLSDASFGKLKEPLLRQTEIYRAFGAASANGRFGISALFTPDQTVGEAALRSPTVFNFYLPDFVQPGTLAQAGLYAPEFQITTATTAIQAPNLYYNSIYTSATPAAAQPVLNLTALSTAPDNATMVSTLNLLMAAGNLSAADQSVIVSALNSLPSNTTALAKAQYALYLVATTAPGAVQQ